MRLYGFLYSCISIAYGIVLWSAWSQAHVLYALPPWIHIWVLNWLPYLLMAVGALGVFRIATRPGNDCPGDLHGRQKHSQKKLEPFLVAGVILSILGLIAVTRMLLGVLSDT